MKSALLQGQRGITLSGVLVFMMLMIFLAYTASRIVPGYVDYWSVQRIMKNIVEQPNAADFSESEIRTRFVKELQLNNIKSVGSEDLLVEKSAGSVQLSVVFAIKNAFIGPVSLCLDFNAEASSN
jgi:Tfp pilus assembly protein PilX